MLPWRYIIILNIIVLYTDIVLLLLGVSYYTRLRAEVCNAVATAVEWSARGPRIEHD